MVKLFTTILAMMAILMCSCNKVDMSGLVVPASADVETRVAESLAINAVRGLIDLQASSDDYSIYVCSDIHTDDYPHRFEQFVRLLRQDVGAVAGLLLGDIANQRGALATAAAVADTTAYTAGAAPVMALVGNHDLFFNQWEDFKRYFGSSTYFFTVTTPNHRDLYIMLDSGGGCHGRRQTEWLADVLARRDNYRHCVVCTHVNLFRNDLSQFISANLPLEETYQLMRMSADNGVELWLQGHDHHREELRYEGVNYVSLENLSDGAANASWLRLDAGKQLAWHFENL